MEAVIKQGDTRPLVAVLTANGKAVDLENTEVAFSMVPKLSGVGTTISLQDAEIEDPPKAGRVAYWWKVDEVSRVGDHRGEFQVTFPNGVVESFPNGEYISVRIIPELA